MFGLGTTLLWIAFGVHSSSTVVFVLGAYRQLRHPRLTGRMHRFTQVTPAYNEAPNARLITASVDRARVAGHFAILVNDGSVDETGAILSGIAQAYGAVLVSLSRNRGKAAALNCGFALATTPTVLSLDADTAIDITPLGDIADLVEKGCADAVAFNIVPAPPLTGLVALQRAEYAYVQAFERFGLAGFGIFITVPGAASLWARRAVDNAGGFSSRTLSEDTDMTLAVQALGGRIVLVPDCTAETECPRTFAALVRQRGRWIWGNLQAGRIHGMAALTRRSGVRRRTPGLIMGVLCLVNLGGFTIASVALVRLIAGDVGRADMAAMLAIAGSTLLRFGATRAVLGPSTPPILISILQVTLVQAISLYAFWWGLLRGLPWRKSW